MKKLISLLLTVCMCLSVSVMLTACGHEHTYETEWSKDTTHHWHACEMDGCDEQKDKAEHSYNDGVCICGFEDPNFQQPLSKSELADAFKSVANQSWIQFGAGTVATVQPLAYTVNLPETDLEEKITPDDLKRAKADAATMFSLIYMIGEYYENDNFIVSENIVSIPLQAVNMSQIPCSGTLHLLPALDKKNNNVKLEMILYLPDMNGMEVSAYYNFDINYDFTANNLIAFNLVMVQDYTQNNVTNTQFSHEKMTQDGKYFWLKPTQSNEYKTAALQICEEFKNKMTTAINLQGSFDTEFNNYLTNAMVAYNTVRNAD